MFFVCDIYRAKNEAILEDRFEEKRQILSARERES